jgi:hypothetical protein
VHYRQGVHYRHARDCMAALSHRDLVNYCTILFLSAAELSTFLSKFRSNISISHQEKLVLVRSDGLKITNKYAIVILVMGSVTSRAIFVGFKLTICSC